MNNDEVLSPDSHVTIDTVSERRRQPMCFGYIGTIVGMRLDQWSYWDSWELVGIPWRHQNKIWL